MTLIDRDELATWLQVDIPEAVADQACEMASGIISGYTHQHIASADHVHTLLVAPSGAVDLPQRPVTAVDRVTVDGDEVEGWTWDGVSPQIRFTPTVAGPSVVVEYTAGWDPVPSVVKAVALALAGRSVSNRRGVRSEQLGDYQVTFGGSDEVVASVVLTKDEKALLDRAVRRGPGTLRQQ